MDASETSPRLIARIAGGFYVLTFIAGISAIFLRGRLGLAAGLIAGACYVVVTLLFYWIFRAVSRGVSFAAAVISLAGCAVGPLSMAHVVPISINPLIFFGLYCLLIAYLVWRSTFLPGVLGPLMAFAGFGWLTFASASLARSLSPYNLGPGILGEGALTVWLVIKGVNEQRWRQQASRRGQQVPDR